MPHTNRLSQLLLFGFSLGICTIVRADEGMWTYQHFPRQLVEEKYGVQLDQVWLDRARQATVRLQNCTASFVSPDGLILTNHHCAAACLDENSTAAKNLLEDGFLAGTREQEIRCKTQIADILMVIEDVTSNVTQATRGLDDKTANEARKKTLTGLEEGCETASRQDRRTGPLKCEAVSLYEGSQHFLYKYRRYDDVRLVFAPEEAIAAFGGDPDNFQFPRWCLDMSMLRAYADGKPIRSPQYFKMDFDGPKPGDPVFVSGHPGSTDRLLTVAQLQGLRNVDLPRNLLRRSELRGRYIQYGKSGGEAERIIAAPLAGLENGLKVQRKLLDALLDDELIRSKHAFTDRGTTNSWFFL